MTDHRVSDFVLKKSNNVVAPVAKYPIKATSDTVSVDPLLLQQCIIVGYNSRELVDVLNYMFILQHYLRQPELCCNLANHLKRIH